MRLRDNFVAIGLSIVLLPSLVYFREIGVIADVPVCECQDRPKNMSSNVLLFGDSITEQYSSKVKATLSELGNVAVLRPMEDMNGWCGTSYGINQCIDRWLDGSEWDVIHFNWGLHDIAPHMYSVFLSPEEYKKNLEVIYKSLKRSLKPKGALIWRTTTAVPHSYPKKKRKNLDVIAINKKSMELFGKNGKYPEVKVNDLYSEIVSVCNLETYCYPYNCDCTWLQDDGVHFSSAGISYSSIAVSKSISEVLSMRNETKIVDSIHERTMHFKLSFWELCLLIQLSLYILLMMITIVALRKKGEILKLGYVESNLGVI